MPAGGDGYDIRWFTPTSEVDLCGHATLASAYVVFHRLKPGTADVAFGSKSGILRVSARDGRIALDFPALPAAPCAPPAGIAQALGAAPSETLHAKVLLAVFPSEPHVRALEPDMAALAKVDPHGVIVTAPGGADVDFVSRFFAPNLGVPEDAVTGSAPCTLTPYWASRLGKTSLHARQVSRRGGELWCEFAGNRVHMAGHAAPYLEGTIEV